MSRCSVPSSRGLGKHAVGCPRGEPRIEEVVERAVHVTPETQRMIRRHEFVVGSQILIHVDQHHVATVDSLLVDHPGEQRKLIDRSNRHDEGRRATPALRGEQFLSYRHRQIVRDRRHVAQHADPHRRATAEIGGGDFQVIEHVAGSLGPAGRGFKPRRTTRAWCREKRPCPRCRAPGPSRFVSRRRTGRCSWWARCR